MKGLIKIPSINKLQSAYNRLLTSFVDEETLCLYTQWSRLDPRLAEILVKHLSQNWLALSPIKLHLSIKSQPWPAAFGVLLEQTRELIEKKYLALYDSWKECVTVEIKKAPGELYFFGTRSFNGTLALNDVELSHNQFTRWGYFGRETLINKSAQALSTRASPTVRKKILSELIKKKKRITVNDYIVALSYNVSRRQAELDLQKFPRLAAEGNTRNRTYKKV